MNISTHTQVKLEAVQELDITEATKLACISSQMDLVQLSRKVASNSGETINIQNVHVVYMGTSAYTRVHRVRNAAHFQSWTVRCLRLNCLL